ARRVNVAPRPPGLAVLPGPGLPLLRRGAANAVWWFALMVFCFFALTGWFYWVALDLSFPARLHAHLIRLRPSYEPAWQLLKLAIAAASTAAWIYLIPRLPRGPYRPMTAWTGSLALLSALVFRCCAVHPVAGQREQLPQHDVGHTRRHANELSLHVEPQSRRAATCATAIFRWNRQLPRC